LRNKSGHGFFLSRQSWRLFQSRMWPKMGEVQKGNLPFAAALAFVPIAIMIVYLRGARAWLGGRVQVSRDADRRSAAAAARSAATSTA
jgi:hypothetical protein